MSDRDRAPQPRFMSAYVRTLIKSAASAHPPSRSQSLRDRFGGRGRVEACRLCPVSAPSRCPSSRLALKTQGKYISPVLLELGWTRKRRWASGGGQYNRFWMPPPTRST